MDSKALTKEFHNVERRVSELEDLIGKIIEVAPTLMENAEVLQALVDYKHNTGITISTEGVWGG